MIGTMLLVLLSCAVIMGTMWGIDYYRARHPKKTVQH